MILPTPWIFTANALGLRLDAQAHLAACRYLCAGCPRLRQIGYPFCLQNQVGVLYFALYFAVFREFFSILLSRSECYGCVNALHF